MKMPNIDIRKPPKLLINVALDLDLIIKLEKLLKRNNESMSKIVRDILRVALK